MIAVLACAGLAHAQTVDNEVQTQIRRAAIKYLGPIDLQDYPELELSLIAALRADCDESVRHEAAIALGNCRRLTLRLLEALNMTALGLNLDGSPAEHSERVRLAAHLSLQSCAGRGLCLPPKSPFFDSGARTTTPEVLPTSFVQPKLAPATPNDCRLAETISSSQPGPAPPSHPFYRSLLSRLGFAPREEADRVDPRLSGVTTIGSDASPAKSSPALSAETRLP
jgi:hypothetical protein